MDDLETQLTRITNREPAVKAWVCRHRDDELRAARSLLPDGPLHGWTFGVKDVIDTFDLPTGRGSPIYAGRRTMYDAACVALVRRAGALIVGKTASTEFALFAPTVTTNPHDPTRTPGGSSSGSAAAVADGMVRAAFGTQTVGSVIRPSAFCGVVGFKPTHQLVPLTGVASLAPSLDTVGWMTRSVGDAQAVFEAITGWHHQSTSRQPTSRPLRIGRYRSQQWPSAQPELGPVLDRTADQLADVGMEIIDVEPLPHLDGVAEAAAQVLDYEIARVFSWERDHHLGRINPLIRKMLDRADRVDIETAGRAQQVLATARAAHREYLTANTIDALMTPSAPGEAPPIATTGDPVFNRVWTTLGVPAINLPVATGPLGLPVGLQLAGVAWADADLLAVAARVETALGSSGSEAG